MQNNTICVSRVSLFKDVINLNVGECLEIMTINGSVFLHLPSGDLQYSTDTFSRFKNTSIAFAYF